MAELPVIEQCKFVPISALVDKEDVHWFYDHLSNNAPFSWGDNNRTLVTADRLYQHLEELAGNEPDDAWPDERADAFFAKLEELVARRIYVDLEN